MASPNTASATPVQEADKRRLTEYFIERIRTRLSGRDAKDIVDTTPVRAIFAGVLQPPRIDLNSQADAPPGTAIGLDFRILPDDESKPVQVRIEPRWSEYYAVFPSFDACRRANAQIVQPVAASPIGSEPAQQSAVPSTQEQEPPEPASEDAAAADADQDEGQVRPPNAGVVILPRAWRRVDVVPSAIEVALAAKQVEAVEIGQSELTEALSKAASNASQDPARWRHLAEPERRERALGEASVLSTPDSYSAVLGKVKGPAAPLPKWSASLRIDSRSETSDARLRRVRILLANTTPSRDEDVQDANLQERSLFDACLRVTVSGGKIVPFDFLLAPKDYKSNPQMDAKGINCVATRHEESSQSLATETLPVFLQPLYRTRDSLQVPFTSLDVADPVAPLENVAGAMDSFLSDWDQFLRNAAPSFLTAPETAACQKERDDFQTEIARFRLGITALREDSVLLKSFRLMNRTFAKLGEKTGGKITSWRLFQIGFIVSQMPCLAVRELSSQRDDVFARSLRSQMEEVGILWFPTGGGKTEAYLGLIAVALVFDRLRGKSRGVTAWMRFPLRMLSLQQLERLSRVIAGLNELRAGEPLLLTGDPFAVGYYVGDGNTPNRISEEGMKRYEQKPDARNDVKLLRKCPHCGSAVEVEPRRAEWRLIHRCTNATCFSNTSVTLSYLRNALPVFVVDNEVYRYLPSVLVGTVDKLAIIARSRHFTQLVRGANQRCPVHGYTSYDDCIESFNGCKTKKRDLERLKPVEDPGLSLLVQDELHLLRAELGVFNGHYEGLLNYLGGRAHLPPKVLAATATIEAYDTHAFHIYLSRSSRFPQPSWRAGESFYATSQPPSVRRFYFGILGHARGIEEPALRVVELYLDEIRRLKASPQAAMQIMGRTDLSEDECQSVLRLYDLELCYVNRKATGGSLIDKLSQVERRLIGDGLGTVQTKLLTGDQTMDDVGATLERIEKERLESGDPRLDVVVATNLISHGVDLERINMMVLCGMPSHYAEYVQATSRSARSHPGLVAVCFRSSDPREISQYEFFPVMHAHMDRLIEAVAVNRFASFAPQKTVRGIIAGLLLCQWTPELYGTGLTRPLDHVPTLNIALGNKPGGSAGTISGCVNVDALRAAVHRIIGVDQVRPPASSAQIVQLRKRVDDAFDDAIGLISRSLEMKLSDVLKPITSFRDVDEGIDFGSIDSGDYAVRLRSR